MDSHHPRFPSAARLNHKLRVSAGYMGTPTDVITGWVKNNGVEAARALARSLPNPCLSPEGAHVVPELTAFVLEKYGHDDRVFDEFVAGVHSLQRYSGDIAAQGGEGRAGFSTTPSPACVNGPHWK